MFKLFAKISLFSTLFSLPFAGFSVGVESSIQSLDFSGSGPLFLSDKQIHEDLHQAKRLLHDNYVRYPLLEQAGVGWQSAFDKLADQLLTKVNPILTHHFQKQLIKALEFTEDSNLQADLFLNKRHYVQRI